jgi:hypothetical protein
MSSYRSKQINPELKMTNKQIAQTILSQLGGNRFCAMVGAKNFVYGDGNLTFSIGRGAKGGINKVRIQLTNADDYTVSFFKLRGVDFKVMSERSGVYCDSLRAVFTEETGFYTSL